MSNWNDKRLTVTYRYNGKAGQTALLKEAKTIDRSVQQIMNSGKGASHLKTRYHGNQINSIMVNVNNSIKTRAMFTLNSLAKDTRDAMKRALKESYVPGGKRTGNLYKSIKTKRVGLTKVEAGVIVPPVNKDGDGVRYDLFKNYGTGQYREGAPKYGNSLRSGGQRATLFFERGVENAEKNINKRLKEAFK